MSNALVYATFDGVATAYHGIGTQTQYFLDSYTRDLEARNKYDLHIAVPDTSRSLAGYVIDEALLGEMQGRAANAGATLHDLPVLQAPLWTTEQWDHLTCGVVDLVEDLLDKYDHVLVIAVDAVYATIGPALEERLSRSDIDRIRLVYALYSSARVPGTLGPDRRAQDEQDAVDFAARNHWAYVADIGVYFTEHLEKAFGARRQDLLPFTLGFALESPELQPLPSSTAEATLADLGIPLDRPLIFSMGRADPIKGLEKVIRAASELRDRCHLVMIAVDYNPGSAAELAKYRSLITDLKLECTFFDQFSRLLPRAMCAYPGTRAVITASVGEALGQIPSEVGLWAREAASAVIVAPTVGGYPEQIDDRASGFLFDGSVRDLVRAVSEALALDAEQRANAAAAAYEKVTRERDNRQSLRSLLRHVEMSWMEESGDGHR